MFATHAPVTALCLAAFLTVVAITDLRTRRIPNLLTVPAAALGLLLNLSTAGSAGALQGGAGMLLGLAIFLPLYIVGGFGAGDVKTMGAVGAFLGAKGALLAAAATLMVGALGGVLVLLCLGEFAALGDFARRWLWRAHSLYATGQVPRFVTAADDASRRRFPYGLAMTCGTLISIMWT